jgi:chromosomal replication initiation ATPase DnaA
MTQYHWTNLRRPHPDEVVDWICSRMAIDRQGLLSASRCRVWNLPRRWCAYLLLTEAKVGTKEAGRVMNRSHQTIIWWARWYVEYCRKERLP